MSTTQAAKPAPPVQETLRETLISIVIAFAMAFVFRGFVIEAFVIPTGSMAPTLMGAHTQYQGRHTGHRWTVNATAPLPQDPTQFADPQVGVGVSDPMSGEYREFSQVPLSSGDRILVLKYLYLVREPERFDVVVFKNPTDPSQNYIKRLVGLPGEQLALIDGDVFVRTPGASDPQPASGTLWSLPGWRIARKPLLAQNAVWQTVYDSAEGALNDDRAIIPWTPSTPEGWTIKPREYTFAAGTGKTRGELFFDQSKPRTSQAGVPRRLNWAITDYYAYNETILNSDRSLRSPLFPVGDIRIRAGIRADKPGLTAGVKLVARAHQFDITFSPTQATIAVREPVGQAGVMSEPKVVATAPFTGFTPDAVRNVEVWHADQAIQIWVDGKRIVQAEFDWTPEQRVRFATGRSLESIAQDQLGQSLNILADPGLYREGAVKDLRWWFDGAGVTLYRVAVDRDLYYQPETYKYGSPSPALATGVSSTLRLSNDQFFVCGDNSPASLDGRLWENIDPWVSREFPPPMGPEFREIGVVPRELMLGRAFFVYWPSMIREARPLTTPDFGRMRFIW